MKVFIYGECVSRDIFNFDAVNMHKVDRYFARSAISSAFDSLEVNDEWSDKIASNFQKRMVSCDLKKSLAKEIKEADFDIFLIDFTSERHSLFIFNNGSSCTLSTEIISAGFPQNDTKIGRKILPFSEERFLLWEVGWHKFVQLMKEHNFKDKVVINAVTWAKRTSDHSAFDGVHTEQYLEHVNNYFNRIYERVAIDIPKGQFITAPEEFHIASVEHRWGKSPLHYIDDYYIHLASELIKRLSVLKIRALMDSLNFSFNVSDTEIVFSLSTPDTAVDDFYYAFYLLVNDKKCAESGYKKDKNVCFLYDIKECDDVDIIYYIKDMYGQRESRRLSLKKKEQLVKIDEYLADFEPDRTQRYIKDEYLRLGYDIIGNTLIVSLPYATDQIRIDKNDGIKWSEHSCSLNESGLMWFYSLYYIGFLIKESENNNLLDDYIHSAVHSFLNSSLCFSDNLKNITSADHSASERVLTLINYVTNYADSLEKTKIDALVVAIHFWLEWLASYSWYQNNNHGVMADIAVINGYLFFKSIPDAINFENIALSRLSKTISIAYDNDGFCNENTIGYHSFNNALYTKIIKSLLNDSSSFSSDNLLIIESMSEILISSERALRYSIWQDGSIPPIGDSPIIKTKLESINSSFCFFDSGFAVIKTEDIYFSLLCNSRSIIHKHVDDTSITLRYKNQEIIIDSGSYRYDRTDPYRASLVSSLSHSGLFTSTIDKTICSDYYKNFKPKARVVDFVESIDSFYIKCENIINDGEETLVREIFINLPLSIKIVDSFSFVNSEQVEYASQRFIFDENSSIDKNSNGGFLLNVNGFHFDIKSSASEHSLYRGERDPSYRGWRSKENGEIIETLGMDFYVRDKVSGKITTSISLINDGENFLGENSGENFI